MTVTINDAFSAALEQDATTTETGEPAIAPPPRRPSVVDPDAPHGRAEDGSAKTPYGIGRNGKPRIKPAGPGRKPKDDADKPRVTTAAPAPATATAAAATAAKDFTGDLDDLVDGVWMVLSGLPFRGNLRVRVQAQAAVVQQAKPRLVKAGNIAAQHHDGTAQLIEKLSTGSAAWMLPVMFAAAPFVASSVSLWRTPIEDLADVAAQNEADFKIIISAAQLAAEAES